MAQPHKIRLVVADDHPVFRDGLCRLLALEEDLEVVARVSDGRQVLDVVQRLEPDILLLDLKMSGLDGLAILQRLQVARNKTRVIVLTASDDKNEFVQAMKLGVSGIVLKQTATELLIKSIRNVHAGEIWLDSHTTAAVIRQFVANDEAPAPQGIPQPASGERERTPLSQREREIVALVAQGFKNKEMAEKMFISEQTVRNHLHNIFDKLGVSWVHFDNPHNRQRGPRPYRSPRGLPVPQPEWLRPTIEEALRQLWGASGIPQGYRASLQLALLPLQPNREVEGLIYRAAQVALSNVIQHSRATCVEMSLTVSGGSLILKVQDNGVRQFSAPAGVVSRTGLRSIREQADSLGGGLVIESGPAGTTLEVWVPYSKEAWREAVN